MGDGTRENPYTREDVLRLIQENGGKAEGLDLSKRKFVEAIDLSGLDLQGIILIEAELSKAVLAGTNLQKADLSLANLQESECSRANLREAVLIMANLRDASLAGADLHRADLCFANLQGSKCGGINLREAALMNADLRGAVIAGAEMEGAVFCGMQISSDTQLINIKWGTKYAEPESWQTPHIQPVHPQLLRDRRVHLAAERTYRELKNWHQQAGFYDIAGHFFYWEMEAKRKQMGWWPNPLPRIRQTLYWILCGYGEKPERVIVSALVIIFGLAIAYRFGGLSLPYSIYYSFVSFTALGYGSWLPQPTDWVKGLGAVEAFTGVFMMALFLVTFTRKMTR